MPTYLLLNKLLSVCLCSRIWESRLYVNKNEAKCNLLTVQHLTVAIL